jgi:twitching motility protein PilT
VVFYIGYPLELNLCETEMQRMAKIDRLLKLMIEKGASDLHLAAGQPPALRIDGSLRRINLPALEDSDLRAMLYEVAPEEQVSRFEKSGDIDFGFEKAGWARFRANYFLQQNGVAAVLRVIPGKIKTARELGLPPIIEQLAALPNGLVLVTGPTGSGKSTTLAAIIDVANRSRRDHIVTIEDPIEFVHQSQRCMINQREVGRHTHSFDSALREDPDIILVGEMRDLQTIAMALEAASTGHLVLSTLHTTGAAKTVDRIIEVFPAHEQAQIRTTLADTLRAVVSQVLLRRADQKGRCAAFEVMTATTAVRNLIREGKTHQLTSVIQTGKQHGMQFLDDGILELVEKEVVSPDEAYAATFDKSRLRPLLKNLPAEIVDI